MLILKESPNHPESLILGMGFMLHPISNLLILRTVIQKLQQIHSGSTQ